MIKLDPSQQAFCDSPESNIRLLAPAGCGKTISLLHRCRALASRAKGRQRFLLLSFTNAAAAEMRERLERDSLFASLRGSVRTTTLNSWGWRRLRSYHSTARLLSDSQSLFFAVKNQLNSIVRTHESLRKALGRQKARLQPRELMEVIDNLKSLRFDHGEHTDFKSFNSHVKNLKSLGLDPLLDAQRSRLVKKGVLDQISDESGADDRWKEFFDRFFVFWRSAVTRLYEDLTFTFEDQKYWNYLDMVGGKPVPEPSRFHHVMVDEFQDINPLDLALIDRIVAVNRSTLTIVGDDDQAIFEWRGASPEFILNPDRYFGKKFHTHILESNYRSPRNVVRGSQNLIAHNVRRVDKKVKSVSSRKDAIIEIVSKTDIAEELDFVTEIVRDTKPGRVAVIAKYRAQLIPYEIHFASNQVEFETASDLDLFQGDTLTDIANTLLVRDDQKRKDSIRRNVEAAIDMCNLICMFPLTKTENRNLAGFLTEQAPRTVRDAVAVIGKYQEPIKKKSAMDVCTSALEFLDAKTLAEALRCVAEFEGASFNPLKAVDQIFFTAPPLLQLATLVEKRGWTAQQLEEMIHKAKNSIREFNARTGDDTPGKDINQRPLHLMTATRSKGKEFETVVILSVLDEVWPHKRAETPAQIEAERRLFYVAFTRAKNHIVMLNPAHASLSPFVTELKIKHLHP